MSLALKKEQRENLQNYKVYIEDSSSTSPEYFRLSDVPQILQKGKNLLRIKVHPTNLVEGSQILIDVRDSNGNEIYFEIPDYIEDDKSRIISIWVYNDKGGDNTPNGNATITIVGTAKFDKNGNPIPQNFQNKPNVRWVGTVTVDRDRGNTSPVIFNTKSLPNITLSESIETYTNISQSSGLPVKTIEIGGGTKYTFKGNTPVVQATTTTPFNQEMVGGSLILHGAQFITTARPTTSIPNPTNVSSYTSSIVEVLDNQTVKLATPYTTTFDNRVGTVHTFTSVDVSRYRIEYFSTGSNTTSNSKRAFANITISGSDPIAGVVDKVKVLLKSDGLVGDDELLNEISVPFSSSYLVKIPIPSEHLNDVQKLKVQYLNSIGNISKTETISDSIVFQGNKDRVEGSLGGFRITSTTISSSVTMSNSSSALSLHADGRISGSSVLIRNDIQGTLYTLLDTVNGLVDAQNVGRQLVSDSTTYSRNGVDDGTTFVEQVTYPVTFLPGETHLSICFSARVTKGTSGANQGRIRFQLATAVTSSGIHQSGIDRFDNFNTAEDVYSIVMTGGTVTSSLGQGPDTAGALLPIPDSAKGRYCKIIFSLANDVTSGTAPFSAPGPKTEVKNISIVSTRTFGAAEVSRFQSGDTMLTFA